MERKPTFRKTTSRVAATVAVLTALLAGSDAGARLPGASTWYYTIPKGSTYPQSDWTFFRAYVDYTPHGTGYIYAFDLIVTGATCKKNGQTRTPTSTGGETPSSAHLKIPIKADGSFSGRANVINDKGVASIKGRITSSGAKLTGTATIRTHNNVWGECWGTEKMVPLKGTRIA